MDTPKLRGLEVQFRTRSKVRATAEGKALIFAFKLGPLNFFCIVNMPELEGEFALRPLVYVKLTLSPIGDWELFREHG